MAQGAVHGERAEKMRAGILAAAEVLDRPNRKQTKLAAVDPVHMASS